MNRFISKIARKYSTKVKFKPYNTYLITTIDNNIKYSNLNCEKLKYELLSRNGNINDIQIYSNGSKQKLISIIADIPHKDFLNCTNLKNDLESSCHNMSISVEPIINNTNRHLK